MEMEEVTLSDLAKLRKANAAFFSHSGSQVSHRSKKKNQTYMYSMEIDVKLGRNRFVGGGRGRKDRVR